MMSRIFVDTVEYAYNTRLNNYVVRPIRGFKYRDNAYISILKDTHNKHVIIEDNSPPIIYVGKMSCINAKQLISMKMFGTIADYYSYKYSNCETFNKLVVDTIEEKC